MSPPSKINHKRSLHTRGPVAGTGRRDWSPVEFTRWNESRGFRAEKRTAQLFCAFLLAGSFRRKHEAEVARRSDSMADKL